MIEIMDDHFLNIHVALLNMMLDLSRQLFDRANPQRLLQRAANKIANCTAADYCVLIADEDSRALPLVFDAASRISDFDNLRLAVNNHEPNDSLVRLVDNARQNTQTAKNSHFPLFVYFENQAEQCCKIYLELPSLLFPYAGQLSVLLQTICEFLLFLKNHDPSQKNSLLEKNEQFRKYRNDYSFELLVGESDSLLNLMQTIVQISRSEPQVLIEGETGTGKEMVARTIHNNSPRSNCKLVSVNCGAFPENLLEAEFFGFEKGAFTGAFKTRPGKFEQADGGTLFLDEIDEMSQALQVKLLRVIQWGEYSPLGSDEIKHCNVRLIAASKRSVVDLVREGKFRDDLYYRLNTIKFYLLPLRERNQDIIPLIEHFLKKFAKVTNCPVPELDPVVLYTLKNYAFPGNIRELENLLYRAVILSRGETISIEHLPNEIMQAIRPRQTESGANMLQPFKDAKQEMIEEFERFYLTHALRLADGVVRKAAHLSGMHEKNFYEKMNKYHINPRHQSW